MKLIHDLYSEKYRHNDFVIDLDVVAQFLETQKQSLLKTLKHSYVENVDYKVVDKDRKAKCFLLTPDCVKLMIMQSRSKNAQEMRVYFLQVEKTLMMYKDTINDSLMQRVHGDLYKKKRAQRKPQK